VICLRLWSAQKWPGQQDANGCCATRRGRKNYYGSGSVWSAHLAAMMFSVLQTRVLWHLNRTIG